MTSLMAAGPKALPRLPTLLPSAVRRRTGVAFEIERCIRESGRTMPSGLHFCEHHLSHAAAAYHSSPFERAAILTFDGVGEWATASIAHGTADRIAMLEEIRYPDSLGLLYSAFAHHAGFRVNSGEYKLMGLAPYGSPTFVDAITGELMEIGADGSFLVDQRYFDFVSGSAMTTRRFDALFGGPARRPDEPITRRDCDLACSIQVVLEDVVMRIAEHARALTGERVVVLGGGVALNCVANGKLRTDGPFDEVWVQPAAGDAGSAIGCAQWLFHDVMGNPRQRASGDAMKGCLLGPAHPADDVAAEASRLGRPHRRIPGLKERAAAVAGRLADGKVVGVFQGRMEFGPRALGSRSILADARDGGVSARINDVVKRREDFRPFAPAVLAERASDWFELDGESPYMTFTVPVAAHRLHCGALDADSPDLPLAERAGRERSSVPAVTHVDGSARVQTVDTERFEVFHAILSAFEELTGCPVLLNTSLNVRGEPIACRPEEAYAVLMTTDMDCLLIEDCLFESADQPPWTGAVPTHDPD